MNPAHKFSEEQKAKAMRPVAVDNPIPVFGNSLPELEAKMTEQIAKRSQDAFRYHQLKEVIDHMLAKLDEGTAITLTKDSILTIAFREAVK